MDLPLGCLNFLTTHHVALRIAALAHGCVDARSLPPSMQTQADARGVALPVLRRAEDLQRDGWLIPIEIPPTAALLPVPPRFSSSAVVIESAPSSTVSWVADPVHLVVWLLLIEAWLRGMPATTRAAVAATARHLLASFEERRDVYRKAELPAVAQFFTAFVEACQGLDARLNAPQGHDPEEIPTPCPR